MKVMANLVVVLLGLTIGWFLGKERPTKTSEVVGPAGVSLLGQRQAKAIPRAVDMSLPEHLRLQALAEQEDLTEVASLKASLGAILESKDEQALANLMRQWVALDPLGGFNDCRTLAEPSHRDRGLKAWASQWALADPERALAAIEKLTSPSDREPRYCTISAVASALGGSHPDEVLALMGRAGEYYSEGLQAVAEVAPEKAMAIAQTKNDDSARSILRSWMRRDRPAALGYFSDQDEEEKRHLLEGMGKALADVDPTFALAFMEEHRHLAYDSGTEDRVFQAIGRSLLESGGESASAFFQDLASGKYPHESLLRELLPKFAEIEPAEALALALGRSDKDTLDQVAGKWARDDWDTAYASVMQLEEVSDRNRALEGLLSLSGGVPMDLPYEQIESLLEIAKENALEINLAYALRNMPIEQSEALIAQYPEILDASLEGLLFPRTSDDLKLLAERLPDSPGKFRGLERAVKEWSEKDPATAAEWVRDLEFEGDPESLYEPLLDSWSGYDPNAAKEWIGSLKDSAQRTAAANAYVRINAVLHSADAWQVASDAGDLDLQVMALRGWAGTDPVSASKALQELEVVDPKLEEVFEDAAEQYEAWDRFLNPQ